MLSAFLTQARLLDSPHLIGSNPVLKIDKERPPKGGLSLSIVVEMMGFEPTTPTLRT